MSGEIHFGVHGSVTEERTIRKSVILACPHVIIAQEHYREDGSCRCDDPDYPEMLEWGYTWDGKRWRST